MARRFIGAAAAVVVLFGALLAPALAREGVNLDAASQAIVDQLTLDRATAIATLQRRAEVREAELLTRLSQRNHELRGALSDRDIAMATRARIQDELVSLTAERERLIAQIAGRDSQFAAEIAEYRAQIASIAASPDPRKRAALARYAAGDRDVALDVLVDIQTAETRAVAAGWVDVAQRAVDQHDRGELPLEDAIDVVRRAAEVNVDNDDLWRALAGLLRLAGQNDEAARVEARIF